MKSDTYNGWSNRSTWAVHLNLSNDQVAYDELIQCNNEIEIKDLWLDLFEPNHDRVDLNEVDWNEIFKSILK